MLPSPQQRMLTQTLFATGKVRLGRFEARPEEPLFRAGEPPGWPQGLAEIDRRRYGDTEIAIAFFGE